MAVSGGFGTYNQVVLELCLHSGSTLLLPKALGRVELHQQIPKHSVVCVLRQPPYRPSWEHVEASRMLFRPETEADRNGLFAASFILSSKIPHDRSYLQKLTDLLLTRSRTSRSRGKVVWQIAHFRSVQEDSVMQPPGSRNPGQPLLFIVPT